MDREPCQFVREIHRYEGHKSFVTSVAFSLDGRRVLSGSGGDYQENRWVPGSDNSLRLWEVETEQVIHRFVGHKHMVRSVAFSPDGRHALSGSQDKTIRLWDIETGKELLRLGGWFGKKHTDGVSSVAFSPDGSQVASASEDQSVRLWDLANARQLHCLPGHTGNVYSVAFSPDGNQLLSAGQDQTMRIWDLTTGKQLRRITAHKESVLSAAYSSTGRLALSGGNEGVVRLWDTTSWQELHVFEGCRACFSPDGSRVLTWANTLIRLWSLQSGREVYRIENHGGTVMSVAFSPDGQFAVSGSADYTVRLWKLPSVAEQDAAADRGDC